VAHTHEPNPSEFLSFSDHFERNSNILKSWHGPFFWTQFSLNPASLERKKKNFLNFFPSIFLAKNTFLVEKKEEKSDDVTSLSLPLKLLGASSVNFPSFDIFDVFGWVEKMWSLLKCKKNKGAISDFFPYSS